MPGKMLADDSLDFVLSFFRENKVWHFMCIVCYTDTKLYELSSIIYIWKINNNKYYKIWYAAAKICTLCVNIV